jgi:hypothetical protein
VTRRLDKDSATVALRRRVVPLLAGALLACAGVAWSQQAPATGAAGPAWSALTPAQQHALSPLQRDWNSIDAPRRRKWIEISERFGTLPPAEQARVQSRMAEWAKLTPKERAEARLNFKEAQQVAPQDRKSQWEAYKALPPDQRKQLADRAGNKTPAAKAGKEPDGDAPEAKSSIVPNTAYAARPKAVAPTVAQAQPGATTNLISKRPTPPAHQQTGLPKIATAPGLVDSATLLPKRGPQAAATRSVAASAPAPGKPLR